MEANMTLVLSELKENVGIVTLNHFEKRNALSQALIEELISALEELKELKARAIILRAPKGAKVWSAGHDILELPKSGRDPLSYYDPLESVIRVIAKSPSPVIAMIEGGVWGGACELALTCDILIGSPSTTFAITPAKLGIPYNPTGIIHFLNMLPANQVKELFFTAQPIDANRALKIGLLNHLISDEELEAFTLTLARRITQNSPLSIEVIKEQIRILSNARPLSPETFERIQGLRRRVYDSNDYKEGINSFIEKRSPVFKGE
jgi:methylmalonyl-CoA decarboxylase